MGLTKANLETEVKLLVALAQRHAEIYSVAQKLSSSAVWRSTDGSAQILLSDKEREELEGFIRTYLQEADVIAATLRSHLDDKPKSGADAV